MAAGEASYAFYLIHRQVMFQLGAGRWEPVTGEVTGWSLIWQVMIFFLVIAIALCLPHMIERPAGVWVNRHASVPIRKHAKTSASTRRRPRTGLRRES